MPARSCVQAILVSACKVEVEAIAYRSPDEMPFGAPRSRDPSAFNIDSWYSSILLLSRQLRPTHVTFFRGDFTHGNSTWREHASNEQKTIAVDAKESRLPGRSSRQRVRAAVTNRSRNAATVRSRRKVYVTTRNSGMPGSPAKHLTSPEMASSRLYPVPGPITATLRNSPPADQIYIGGNQFETQRNCPALFQYLLPDRSGRQGMLALKTHSITRHVTSPHDFS